MQNEKKHTTISPTLSEELYRFGADGNLKSVAESGNTRTNYQKNQLYSAYFDFITLFKQN